MWLKIVDMNVKPQNKHTNEKCLLLKIFNGPDFSGSSGIIVFDELSKLYWYKTLSPTRNVNIRLVNKLRNPNEILPYKLGKHKS